MKYGIARFVYGISAVALFLLALGVLLTPESAIQPSGWRGWTRYYTLNAIVAIFPFAFSVFCWKRYRHWTKSAKKKTIARTTN